MQDVAIATAYPKKQILNPKSVLLLFEMFIVLKLFEAQNQIKSISTDAERCQAIMSTNAVAWLLSFVYRSGTRLSTLTTALDALRDSLKARKRDTGFCGHSEDVVRHAVSPRSCFSVYYKIHDVNMPHSHAIIY